MKKNSVYIALLVMVCLIFLVSYCSSRQKQHQQLMNLVASRDSLRSYQIQLEGLQYSVQERDATILTQQEALRVGLLEQQRLKALYLKEVATNTSLTGEIRVLRDSLHLSAQTEFVVIHDTVTDQDMSCVRVPFTLLDVDEPYLSLTAGMNENRTAWFNLSVPFTGEVTVGYKKVGFLKTQPVGVFTTSNPYLKVTGMDALIVKEKRHWYQRWGVGFLSGAVLMELVNIVSK